MMKKIPALLIAMSCVLLIACSKGSSVNGHSVKTAYKSVKMMKERLPLDHRMEFQVSFWTIRDANKGNDDAFLDAVDGKSPEQIVATAKEIYQQRKANNYAGYANYATWEEMITEYGKERNEQDKHRKKEEGGGEKDNVLYQLR